MKKRDGASLLNVMVFMLFAAMITAQVFFFAKWQADSVAEEREIMMYRLNLDSLVEEGKDALKETNPNKKIVHNEKLKASDIYKLIDEKLAAPKETDILLNVLESYDTSILSNDGEQDTTASSPSATSYITIAIQELKYAQYGDNKSKAVEYINKLKESFPDVYKGILAKFNKALSANRSASCVKLTYSQFYDGNDDGVSTKAIYAKANDAIPDEEWEIPQKWITEYSDTYHIVIHDLDYVFDETFSNTDRENFIKNYSGKLMYKKVFAAMPPTKKIVKDSDDNQVYEEDGVTPKIQITGRYYLIRAWVQLPQNYYDRKLMYQVLVWRDEYGDDPTYEVKVLSFQEVWF